MAKSKIREEFEKAFAKARDDKGAGETFEFRGKTYSTNYAKEKPAKSEELEEISVRAPRKLSAEPDSRTDSPAMRANRAAMESAEKGTTKRGDVPAAVTRRREQDAKTTAGLAAATMGPIAAGGTALAGGGVRPLAAALRTRMPTGKEMATEALREPMRKALRRQPGGYAKGGLTGRDGCAIRGMTKGRNV